MRCSGDPALVLMKPRRHSCLHRRAGVRTVAIGLPWPTRLQLFNCAELRQLALDCPRLEKLSVQASSNLTAYRYRQQRTATNQLITQAIDQLITLQVEACSPCSCFQTALGKFSTPWVPTSMHNNVVITRSS